MSKMRILGRINMFYSQKSYPKTKLGQCQDTIAQSGCFLVSFCNLLKELQVADLTPPFFNSYAFPKGGCLANAPLWASMHDLTYEKTAKAPGKVCIAETDHWKSQGVPQHFFLIRKDGKIVDPLDKNPKWRTNPYHIISYRVFTPKTATEPNPKPKTVAKPTTPVKNSPTPPQSVTSTNPGVSIQYVTDNVQVPPSNAPKIEEPLQSPMVELFKKVLALIFKKQ